MAQRNETFGIFHTERFMPTNDNTFDKLWKESTSSQQLVSVATTSGLLLSEAPNRVGIMLSSPPTNAVTISMERTAVGNQGITLYPGGDPLILSAALHGDVVTRAWTAISPAGSQSVSVIEVFLS